MGYFKQKMIELEGKNLSNVPKKNLCKNHISDNAINNFIRKNSSKGYCDYCKKNVNVVSLESLLEFMMIGISNFYEDAGNFLGYNSQDGGYQGETFDSNELIQDLIGLDADPFELTEDIVNSIDNIAWAEPDMYYDNQRDELMYKWSYFKDLIKHQSRYFFQQNITSQDTRNAYAILKEVGKITNTLNLIKKIDKTTTIYRCIQHHKDESFNVIEKLVSPPNKYAIYPNRFSPSGVSMLYSAFDKNTAIKETLSRVDKKKNMITISEFKFKRDINVIDFTQLPQLPSLFDYNKIKSYYLILFLKDLVSDFTQNIEKDGKEHIEYVPTQVVTEYFRYSFNKNRKKKIEGFIYPSSKNPLKTSSVIFWNNNECIDNLELINQKTEKIRKNI